MLKFSIILFAALVSAQEEIEPPFFRKDYTLLAELGAFYKLHKIRTNFTEAVSLCNLEGAELFRPRSLIESKTVSGRIVGNQTKLIWIGVHDLYSEGHFITLDGVPIEETYSNWGPDEPNNANGMEEEDCVKMSVKELQFNDCNCKISGNFICKRSAEGLTENVLCPTYDLDYVYNDALDACYKFHKKPKKWSGAFATCKAEESTLVVINSEMEAEFLSGLISSSTIEKIEGNFDRNIFLVGFNDLLNEGRYVTVDGKTTAVAGYDKWSPGQPDNYENNENCGSIHSNGLLNDANCDTKALFICEMILPPFTIQKSEVLIQPRFVNTTE